ncbi:unnamed protein product [Paramecium sonneborni]|uniref:Uncharacterized protein n=1 Tax=Paramecium sonneborni TaxID=65129 RepID=A0A8S1LYL7_9CILI|nr:unnamed protein product [Paramecium sonneborni]
MLFVQIVSQNNILLGQYGNDHQSRLERVKDDLLIFFFNDYHHEYSIQFSKKSKQIPIILKKQKEDYSRIDLILLRYIPIEDSDQDALFQKVLEEIQSQSQEFEKLQIYKDIILSIYKEES